MKPLIMTSPLPTSTTDNSFSPSTEPNPASSAPLPKSQLPRGSCQDDSFHQFADIPSAVAVAAYFCHRCGGDPSGGYFPTAGGGGAQPYGSFPGSGDDLMALQSELPLLWETSMRISIWQLGNAYMLYTFSYSADYLQVLTRSPASFRGHILHINKYKPFFRPFAEQLDSIPVWIQLPGLAFELCSKSAIRRIASYFGTPLKVDLRRHCHEGSGINVKNITISSPKDSPNTDGIHLQNSKNVEIKHSTIGCGDDCVSIQSGCSNVHIHHISCSPSHGIRVGGLGKGNSLACVSNVSVENVIVQNALSRVRIQTWQGGLGSVRNVTFSNVRVSSVETPIMIDQYYCNRKHCRNNTDAVTISDVSYKGITGTYLLRPTYLACSDSAPCTDIDLKDIHLPLVNESLIPQVAFCWKSYGKSQGFLGPTRIGCLQTGGRMLKALTKSHNTTCY